MYYSTLNISLAENSAQSNQFILIYTPSNCIQVVRLLRTLCANETFSFLFCFIKNEIFLIIKMILSLFFYFFILFFLH